MNRTPANRRARAAFAIAGAALVVALAAAASNASKAVGSALACTSLRNVIGFSVKVTETVGAVVTGQSPPAGTRTIQVGNVMSQVHLHLGDKRHFGRYYDFKGTATGGRVAVDNYFEDTGLDYTGELTYDKPANFATRESVASAGKAAAAVPPGS
jgi:hypothetical protein